MVITSEAYKLAIETIRATCRFSLSESLRNVSGFPHGDCLKHPRLIEWPRSRRRTGGVCYLFVSPEMSMIVAVYLIV